MEKKSAILELDFQANQNWQINERLFNKFGFFCKKINNENKIAYTKNELNLIKFAPNNLTLQGLRIENLVKFFEMYHKNLQLLFVSKELEDLESFKLVYIEFLGTRLLKSFQEGVRGIEVNEEPIPYLKSNITSTLVEADSKGRLPDCFLKYEIPDCFNRRYSQPTWFYVIQGKFNLSKQIREEQLYSFLKQTSCYYEKIFKKYSGISEAEDSFLLKNNRFYL